MEGLDRLILEHHVSLKICELCGRLYCQRSGATQYCGACEFELREFPPIGSRPARGRPRAAKPEFLAKPEIEVRE
jgi:hypothetical protein